MDATALVEDDEHGCPPVCDQLRLFIEGGFFATEKDPNNSFRANFFLSKIIPDQLAVCQQTISTMLGKHEDVRIDLLGQLGRVHENYSRLLDANTRLITTSPTSRENQYTSRDLSLFSNMPSILESVKNILERTRDAVVAYAPPGKHTDSILASMDTSIEQNTMFLRMVNDFFKPHVLVAKRWESPGRLVKSAHLDEVQEEAKVPLTTLIETFGNVKVRSMLFANRVYSVAKTFNETLPKQLGYLKRIASGWERANSDLSDLATADEIQSLANKLAVLGDYLNEVLNGTPPTTLHQITLQSFPEIIDDYQRIITAYLKAGEEGRIEINTVSSRDDIEDMANCMKSAYRQHFGAYLDNPALVPGHA